jgi:hypothetical protein
VRNVARQVGLEQDVHGAANAHPAFERQFRMLGDQRVAAIGAKQIFGADGELFARQSIEQRRGDALRVLRMAFVLCRHARLRPA